MHSGFRVIEYRAGTLEAGKGSSDKSDGGVVLDEHCICRSAFDSGRGHGTCHTSSRHGRLQRKHKPASVNVPNN